MKECRAFDVFTLGTQRVVDEDTGVLTVPGVIAKAGNVQTYRASELGLDGDPTRTVRLYRPREEVAKSAPSFARRPLTNNHPPEKWITTSNWAKHAVGDSGDTVDMQGDDMVTTLIFRQQKAIDALKSGKVALSNGYRFRFDDSKTRTPEGQLVDGFMTDIRGNHIALVDRGRGGPGCVVADNEDEKEIHMATRITKIGKHSCELDLAAADAAEAQTAEMTKLAADFKTAQDMAIESEKRAVEAEAQVKTHLDKIAALDAEIVTLKAAAPAAPSAEAIETAAELRQSVVGDALGLVPDLAPKGKTVDAIRREALTTASAKLANVKAVVDSILRGTDIAKADAVVVDAAFSAACSVAKTVTATDPTLGAALLGKDPKAAKANDSATAGAPNLTGYALYAYNLTHKTKAQPTA